MQYDIEKILSELTLSEKVSLCHGKSNFSVVGVPRFGIPPLVMSDGPHGVRQELAIDGFEPLPGEHDFITYLPTATALAATWSVECAAGFGAVLGEEARARGKDIILGPGLNIHRNPLCGRNFEYMSEDPQLAANLGVNVIVGIQEQGTAACAKHYALNSQELNRNGVDARADERTIHEIYLPAFEAAVKTGGVFTIMGAYNKFRGQHCCHNDYLLNQVLKDQWGFDGVVISDWAGCHDTFEAARFGLDIEMGTGSNFEQYYLAQPFRLALESGALPACYVDDKARRVLRLHEKLAAKRENLPPAQVNTPEHQAMARRIAEEAMVLLKNERNTLPLLPHSVQKILVVGANAKNIHHAGGESSAVKAQYEISPWDGLVEAFGADKLEFAMGYPAALECAVTPAMKWELGVYPRSSNEAVKSWSSDRLDCDWERDMPAELAANFGRIIAKSEFTATESGEWTLVLYGGIHAFLYPDDNRYMMPATETLPGVPNTVRVPLQAGQKLGISIVYRRHPHKELEPLRFQVIPPNAKIDYSALAARAAQADACIFIGGQTHAQDFEGNDRYSLTLPDGQDALIAALAGAGKRFIVALAGGSPVTMPWVDRVPAIMQIWYAGSEGGRAFANLITGKVNPSGKLPMTFPAQMADMPHVALQDYNAEICNYAEGVFVGYRWYDKHGKNVLFPFGHGLSYTQFTYSDLEIKAHPTSGFAVRVSCRIANSGTVAGAEVAQLYIGQENCSIPRPVRELKGFAKVRLHPGESVKVEFNLTERDLAYYHPNDRRWTVEYGRFLFSVGSSSRDLRLNGALEFGA